MNAAGNSSHLERRQSTIGKMSTLQSSLAQSMCSIDLADSNWIQDLPCLPVPDLKTTLDRYLGSLKPVISEQQYNKTLDIVKDFMRHEGPQLQRDLKDYANKCQNWATDFWLDDMYLSNPLPLPINSNPLFLFPKQMFETSDDMLMFATRVIQFSVDFKNRIDRQTLSQDYGSGHGKGKPLCMETYKNFFHSCRIPHEDKDRLLRQSRRSNHIVVASCNQFFILRLGQDPLDNPYRNDLPPLDESCIFEQLSRIYRVSRQRVARYQHSIKNADGKQQQQQPTLTTSKSIAKIGLLTTENRKMWAKLHKHLCKDEVNLKSISQIEDCLFVMCLDSIVEIGNSDPSTDASVKDKVKTTCQPNGNTESSSRVEAHDEEQVKMATTILTGGSCSKFSANRWFDKFLQVIVGRDGVCGINIEHSASEGITVLRFLEEFPEYLDRLHNNNQQQSSSSSSALGRSFNFSASFTPPSELSNIDLSEPKTTSVGQQQQPNSNKVSSGGRCQSMSSSSWSPSLASPTLSPSLLIKEDDSIIPLEWHLDQDIITAIHEAQIRMDKMIENFDFKIMKFNEFGKTLIKSHNLSPDAFIQLALQLTYYKLHNQLVSTYESASLRQFRLGRVDNIRANSCEVLDWVKSMIEWTTIKTANSNKTAFELFQVAIKRQVEILRYTITGGGPDNHLLALRELAKVRFDQLPQLYHDDSYKEYLKFKLSTSQLPSERGIIVGYGAVVPDGYGCSYNPCENYIVFCIASFRDCPETSSAKFADTLNASLREMEQLLVSTHTHKFDT